MSKQIERILICILWLLASALGAGFWLNTMFGFNIFSTQHWQYLGYLQAAQTPVRPAFYISLTAAILICLVVLYILMRPADAMRRLRMIRTKNPAAKHAAPRAEIQEPATPTAPRQSATAPDIAPPRAPSPARPMRPAISAEVRSAPRTAAPAAPIYAPPATPTGPTDEQKRTLRAIFEDAGYTVKDAPKIGNFKPGLLAIGTNEQLFIGGINIEEQPLADAMERLASLFADTLDDIEISIYGFAVAPSSEIRNPDIRTFSDTDELREYLSENKNTPPADASEQENFDAYSEFIDTVITYMDKT